MIKKYAARFFITLIGTLFIILGTVWGMLGIFGEKSTGLITDVRREMGERTDFKSGRYTYSISYSFKLSDGETVHGNAKEIRNGVYTKNLNNSVSIRYLKIFPQINALEKDVGFDVGKITIILAGCLLVFVVNKY